MNTLYKLVSWDFDMVKFSEELNRLHDHFSWGELGEIIGVSKSCVHNWANGHVSGEFPHPNMSNFMAVCNECDLDPREFFILRDE